MRPEMTLLLCPVLLHGFLLVPTRWAESGRRAAVPARWGTLVASEDGNADQNPPVDEEFSKDLYAELNIRMDGDQAEAAGTAESDFEGESDSDLSSFTDELYAHLSKRPEYATSEFYKGIKSRVDVTEPMYSELDRRREMLTNASLPNPSLGPNDVIDLVLRALQDVDYPYEGHGVEVLMNCTGPGSSINPGSQKVSPEMLYKYRILLEWSSIQYLSKLEMSLNNNRGFQRVKMKSLNGAWVPVTFQLSKYETEAGSVWLIDQFLVKSADRRGEPAGPESIF